MIRRAQSRYAGRAWSRRAARFFALLLAALSAPLHPCTAQIPAAVLQAVRFEQKQGSRVPEDLRLIDDKGREVDLGEYLGRRPVILTLVRFRCRMLCPEVLDGVIRALQPLPAVPGQDYEWLAVSLDPNETPSTAGGKKRVFAERYAKGRMGAGWDFVVARRRDIDRLADAVGCRYFLQPNSGAWAEPAGVVLLTPDGRVSSYLLGTDFGSADLARALDRARAGEIDPVGSATAPLTARCYPYDPSEVPRSRTVVNAVRLASGLSAALVGVWIAALLRRERRNERRAA